MAKRKSSIDAATIGAFIILAIIILDISKLADRFGATATVLIFVALIGLYVFYRIQKRATRMAYLRKKYGDETIVQKIMKRCYWQGQTSEQLIDSLGNPSATDDMLLKTRKREVWKYNQQGKNRYGLRLTLDNDILVKWERKN